VIPVNVPWAQQMSRWRKYFSRHWAEFLRCLWGLRARHFDWGFTGRADIRENFILWVAGVNRRIGYGFGYGASLLTDVVSPDLARPHYSDRWLHLLEYVGKPVFDRQPEIKLTREEKHAARQFLDNLGIRESDLVIGVHAGARNTVRQWGEQSFLQVAEKVAASYPVKVLWFHEPGSPDPPRRRGLIAVALPLRQFLAVVSECRVLLCNDTGPMHLAISVGVPVVSVFGPTLPAWFGPRNEQSRVVLHEGVWCRPCFDYCIFDQPYCLRAISVDEVLKASIEVLERATNTKTIKNCSRTDNSVLETAD
jgi:ADP-heptose:LPS heptosyltransferase